MTRALTLILSATLATACAGRNEVQYAASVNVADPELVAVGPDVEVVANASEPVFRTNHAFWLYRGDRWYRSTSLRGEWVRIVTPPRALTVITEPRRYANYRAETRTVYHTPPQPPVRFEDPEPTDRESTDRVPQDPTLPSQPGTDPLHPHANPMPNEPDDLGRPDPIRN